MDFVTIGHPEPWVGRRWSVREFASDVWKWQLPRVGDELHVLVRNKDERLWLKGVKSHCCAVELPSNSIYWLDEHSSMAAPPLIFAQMSECLPLPDLVMLGYELCGYFTRDDRDPINGPVTDDIPAATRVEELIDFVREIKGFKGRNKAQYALSYVVDNARSVPEAILASLYSLPPEELGYGMGPVVLNQRVKVSESSDRRYAESRYPDILFTFAPIGINYDGNDHLDLDGLVRAAFQVMTEEGDARALALQILAGKRDEIRAKVVDDMKRNRQLAANGRLVFPVVKEDLYGFGCLDSLTRDLLACARAYFGVNTQQYENALEDSELCRERFRLISSMLPHRRSAIGGFGS